MIEFLSLVLIVAMAGYLMFIGTIIPISKEFALSEQALNIISVAGKMVANDINKYYPDAKFIVEVGSGMGGVLRYIARHTHVCNIVGLENMPFDVIVSRILGIFVGRRVRTIWCDAYDWLAKTGLHIDIAVAYMGPKHTSALARYKNKIDVVISIDFEIDGMSPVRVVDLGHGYTVFNNKKYPHRLYVYEFNRG